MESTTRDWLRKGMILCTIARESKKLKVKVKVRKPIACRVMWVVVVHVVRTKCVRNISNGGEPMSQKRAHILARTRCAQVYPSYPVLPGDQERDPELVIGEHLVEGYSW